MRGGLNVDGMINAIDGSSLEAKDQNVSSTTDLDEAKCRHCGRSFSTLLALQQHIVCEHKEELRTELNQYQHKKYRILDDSMANNGKFIHHKKRKILEAAKEENENNGNGENTHLYNKISGWSSRNTSEDNVAKANKSVQNDNSRPCEEENELVINNNGVDALSSYTHKKLRKDYISSKDTDLEKVHGEEISIDKDVVNGNDVQNIECHSSKSGYDSSEQFLYKPYSGPSNGSSQGIQGRNVPIDLPSSPLFRPTDMPNPNALPPHHTYPNYPAINMNMYGNFAMPLNLPHPMMYMNPGMFMPPITNGVMPPNNHMATSKPLDNENVGQEQKFPYSQCSPASKKNPHLSGRSNIGNRKQRIKDDKQDNNTDESKINILEIYECKICTRKFSQVGNFHNHMKLHSEKVCVCGICKLECADSYELQRHMRTTHTGNMPYKCNECDREFSQYNNLRRHLRVHSGKSYKCHICGRSFNEVFYLEMHIGSHTGERTYKCGVCNLIFKDNSELQKHVKTHKAEELHTCDVCGKSFSKACVLRQHKKMHLGIRPYKCDVCAKAFIHRHHLTIHMRMHTSNKPYTCKLCKKEFSQTSHLYKHIKQHAVHLGKDITIERRNGASPTDAEIEEMFEKIQASDGYTNLGSTNSEVSDSNSHDSFDKEASMLTQGKNHFNSKDLDLPSQETKVPCDALNRYSPISSVSSQCDIQSDAGSIDVVNSADSPNAQEIQEIMKSADHSLKSIHENNDFTKSISITPAVIGTAASTKNAERHELEDTNTIFHSNSNPKNPDCDQNIREVNTENMSLKLEQCESPLLPSRVADVDAVHTETCSEVSKPGSLSNNSDSPCPSLSSHSDVSQCDSLQQKSLSSRDSRSPHHSSLGSLSDEEGRSIQQPFKVKKRRNPPKPKKNVEQPEKSSLLNIPYNLAESDQIPRISSAMGSNPKLSSDMQNLYLMQLQQLQGLHMALFANAMMSHNGIPGMNNPLQPSLGMSGSPSFSGNPMGTIASPMRNSPVASFPSVRSPYGARADMDSSLGCDSFDNRAGPVDLRVEKA